MAEEVITVDLHVGHGIHHVFTGTDAQLRAMAADALSDADESMRAVGKGILDALASRVEAACAGCGGIYVGADLDDDGRCPRCCEECGGECKDRADR